MTDYEQKARDLLAEARLDQAAHPIGIHHHQARLIGEVLRELDELKKGIVSLRRHLCKWSHLISVPTVLEKLNEILPVDLRHELFEEQPKPEVQP